jgi:hypothetical protein
MQEQDRESEQHKVETEIQKIDATIRGKSVFVRQKMFGGIEVKRAGKGYHWNGEIADGFASHHCGIASKAKNLLFDVGEAVYKKRNTSKTETDTSYFKVLSYGSGFTGLGSGFVQDLRRIALTIYDTRFEMAGGYDLKLHRTLSDNIDIAQQLSSGSTLENIVYLGADKKSLIELMQVFQRQIHSVKSKQPSEDIQKIWDCFNTIIENSIQKISNVQYGKPLLDEIRNAPSAFSAIMSKSGLKTCQTRDSATTIRPKQ